MGNFILLLSYVPNQKEVWKLVRAKRQNMVQAFGVLLERNGEEEPVVSQASWNQLVRLHRWVVGVDFTQRPTQRCVTC